MPFNSFAFAVFLAATLAAYNVVPLRARSALLLSASYLFYAYAHTPHLALLLLVTATTYYAARVLSARREKLLLWLSVAGILLPLLGFKYYNFTAAVLNQASSTPRLGLADVVLPIGISFYSFQAISYVVDVYRGAVAAEPRLHRVALFLAFFPQILAGPIERANKLLPQLRSLSPMTAGDVYIGAKYLLWGFFCKLVVADNIALIVDQVLLSPEKHSGSSLVATFGIYSFQIYFDFLGYTSIAIGLGRLFGVELSRNFYTPYLASSVRDFWHRWHVTLSTWFRDYIYIPLGGNRTHGGSRSGQLLLVFLLSGLWHGAALNFLAWGGIHGAAYLAEEAVRNQLPAGAQIVPPRLLGATKVLATFAFVTFAWIFFRVSDFSEIRIVIARIAHVDTEVPYWLISDAFTGTATIVLAGILASAILLDFNGIALRIVRSVPETTRGLLGELAVVNWLLVTVILTGGVGTRDFIYFRF